MEPTENDTMSARYKSKVGKIESWIVNNGRIFLIVGCNVDARKFESM
jgi:hypothetical protein